VDKERGRGKPRRRARGKAGADELGSKGLTDPSPCRKKFRRPLETFLGLPNFFVVATAAIGMPSGSRRLRRAPDGVRRPQDWEGEKLFLHRGISARSFRRQFTLTDHVEVKGARFENGLLIVDLVRESREAMKPRRISIGDPSHDLRP